MPAKVCSRIISQYLMYTAVLFLLSFSQLLFNLLVVNMLQISKLVSRSELEFCVVISRTCKVHDLILIWALSKLNSGGEHILGCYHGILLSTVTLLFLFQLLVFNVFHWNAEASFCISGFGLEFLNALLAQTFYGGAFSMRPRCIWCMTLRWKLHDTCVGTSPICFVVHYIMCSSSFFLFESLWWRFNQLGSWLRLHLTLMEYGVRIL